MFQVGTSNFVGNITCDQSITPTYDFPPTFTINQIGGKRSMAFTENGTYTTGYNYVTATIPMGYYLVQGHLD